MEPCGTPLCIGMTPECSPLTCILETRPERYASIQRTTASPRPKDLIFDKILHIIEVKLTGRQLETSSGEEHSKYIDVVSEFPQGSLLTCSFLAMQK